MATSEGHTLASVSERIERLNKAVDELRQVEAAQTAANPPKTELSAALGALNLTARVHTENVKALLDIAVMLASDIDALRTRVGVD